MGSRFEGNTKFAVNVFKELSANDPSDNLLYSPVSIISSLLMVLLGARNNTEAQILKVYQDTFYQKGKKRVGCEVKLIDKTHVHQRFQELISHINKPCANYSLGLVNQLFGETSYDFLTVKSTEKFYHAGLEKLNFKQASEDSRRHINAWVEEKTSGENDNKSLVFAFSKTCNIVRACETDKAGKSTIVNHYLLHQSPSNLYEILAKNRFLVLSMDTSEQISVI
uniref:Serpin domain-containing protein n=1 Tax=Pseudonaja textilis TaxID=8673 RepID=A0A670Z9V4_PSETE